MNRSSERSSTKIGKKILTVIISLIFLAIQIAIIYFSLKLKEFRWLYIFVEVLSILIVLITYRNVNDSSSYKLTWTIIILTLPIVGTVLYILVKNSQTLSKAKIKKIEANLYSTIEENHVEKTIENDEINKLVSFVKKDTKCDVYNNSKVEFYNDGKQMFDAIIDSIKMATKYIFLEYFIVADGKLFSSLLDVLEQKGNEGVEIKFIYDDVGSVRVLKRKSKKRLIKIKNLEFVPFAPLGQNMNPIINYRDHRKICVIDGKYAYIGGANIADEYVHLIERFGVWRDNGIKITGEAVNNLIRLFIETWYLSTSKILDFNAYKAKHEECCYNSYIQPFGDGPMNRKNTFYDLFLSMFSIAKKRIYISTPYFIIDDMMIKCIVIACKMGIDVKILIPGIPDKKSAYNLTLAHLGEILAAGGKVYKYKKGFNHAKNIIVDDEYAFCGTVNIDYRSLFLHYECGALIINDSIIDEMKVDFEKEIMEAEELTLETWKKRNIFSRVFAFVFRVFSPLF